MIRAIDDFLIDRVFQRMSDVLARWVSCYGIAAFLLTGAVLLAFASAAMWQSWVGILPGLLGIFFVGRLVQAHQLERAAHSDVMPEVRVKLGLWRLIYVAICGNDLIAEIFIKLSFPSWSENIGFLLYTLAVYFMACRKLPPKPRRARIPADAVAALVP